MTTKKEGAAPDNKSVVKRAIMAAGTLLTIGFDEMRAQSMIEKYQLANFKQDYSEEARVKRAEKLRDDIEKMEAKFRGAIDANGKRLESAANWKPLASFFNETLAHVEEHHFTENANEAVRKDFEKFKLVKVTKEQEEVIRDYHTNRARANWDKVLRIRVLLDKKGLLKKAAPKLPTEAELEKIANEGVNQG